MPPKSVASPAPKTKVSTLAKKTNNVSLPSTASPKPKVSKVELKIPDKRPVTDTERKWCEQFLGLSFIKLLDDGSNIPEPSDLKSMETAHPELALRSAWRAVFLKARDLLLEDDEKDEPEAFCADDAAIRALELGVHGGHQTIVDWVYVWLWWFWE